MANYVCMYVEDEESTKWPLITVIDVNWPLKRIKKFQIVFI